MPQHAEFDRLAVGGFQKLAQLLCFADPLIVELDDDIVDFEACLRPAALFRRGRDHEAARFIEAKLSAKQEVPKQVVKDTKAKGLFTGKLVGSKLTWKLTFSGLTGKATAAHIHMGAMGKAGNVVVPLCAPCKSGAHGKATLSAAVKKALAHHKLYVNVHTAKNPNGETRGQLAKM